MNIKILFIITLQRCKISRYKRLFSVIFIRVRYSLDINNFRLSENVFIPSKTKAPVCGCFVIVQLKSTRLKERDTGIFSFQSFVSYTNEDLRIQLVETTLHVSRTD